MRQGPPSGWKCACSYRGYWTCGGFAVQCNSNEDCPGGCTTYECCIRGGGDCGGYPPVGGQNRHKAFLPTKDYLAPRGLVLPMQRKPQQVRKLGSGCNCEYYDDFGRGGCRIKQVYINT